MSERKELWLPTSTMQVTVENGQVRIVETMTMEKRKVKDVAGFSQGNERSCDGEPRR